MQENEGAIVERLNSVATQYVKALVGHGSEDGQESRLIVSANDIRAVRRYVNWALELPSGLEQTRQLLGYEQADSPGLEPADIQSLYQTVKDHARTWSALEVGIKNAGTDLVYFSDALKSSGEALVTFVEGLEGYRSAVGTVGDLPPGGIAEMPVVDLTNRDRNRIATLQALVQDLCIVIADCSRNTSTVNADLSAFKRELKSRISPSLGLKMTLIRRSNKNARLAELNAELETLDREIEARSDSFQDFLEQQWALASFAQALFVPDSPFPHMTGLESLLHRKRALVKEIRQHSALLASLAQLHTLFQDLRVRVDAAVMGASNLESLWILIQTYIDGSAKRLQNVDDATFLVVFVARLKTMIAAWGEVKHYSRNLLVAFDCAVLEARP